MLTEDPEFAPRSKRPWQGGNQNGRNTLTRWSYPMKSGLFVPPSQNNTEKSKPEKLSKTGLPRSPAPLSISAINRDEPVRTRGCCSCHAAKASSRNISFGTDGPHSCSKGNRALPVRFNTPPQLRFTTKATLKLWDLPQIFSRMLQENCFAPNKECGRWRPITEVSGSTALSAIIQCMQSKGLTNFRG